MFTQKKKYIPNYTLCPLSLWSHFIVYFNKLKVDETYTALKTNCIHTSPLEQFKIVVLVPPGGRPISHVHLQYT